MSHKDKRQIRKIIFEHFDHIVAQWEQFQASTITMGTYHKVDEIRVEAGILRLKIGDRVVEKTLSELSPLFASAKDSELACYQVSPSGYGIYWPLLDEDISIDGLLGITH